MQFEGKFTDETRAALRTKRKELGLSYDELAYFLGVQWCTYRKWELGPTGRCNIKYASRLEALLNNEYDGELESIHRRHGAITDYKADAAVNKALCSLGLACRLVSEMPELSRSLDSRLNAAFKRVIETVLAGE